MGNPWGRRPVTGMALPCERIRTFLEDWKKST
jgi:hypothetical protein